MNHISLFLSRPAGLDALGPTDRQVGGEAALAGTDPSEEESADFASVFGRLLNGPLSEDAQHLFRELGTDPRFEGALRQAGLGSDALRLMSELGLDEQGPAAMKGLSELETLNDSLDDISRELKQRVERVQDRMLAEFGHKVRVVETHRSQERQLELYAQGRTTPGPIVTWTERSAHTEGLAVDVIVDGGYHNDQAFDRLQRIAREEGLKTLGPSDRGHLELDRQTTVVEAGSRARGLATIASVARVAATARVATPGSIGTAASGAGLETPQVASSPETSAGPSGDMPRPPIVKVGRPDILEASAGLETLRPEAPRVEIPKTEAGPESVGVEADAGRADIAGGSSRRGSAGSEQNDSGKGRSDRDEMTRIIDESSKSNKPAPDSPAEGVFRKDPIADSHAPSVSGTVTSSAEAAIARAEAAQATSGAEAIERVAQIRDLQLDGRSHRVSRLVLDIPDGVDSLGKLDISARGDLINARIDANQPSLAEQLRVHVAELQRGLAGRGLQPELLQVRDAQILDAMRFAGAAGGSTAGGEVATARSEAGGGSSGSSGDRDNKSGEFNRNNTNDARSNDQRGARREDGRRNER